MAETKIPEKMQAAVYEAYGDDPEKLIKVKEVPVPRPGAWDVLLRVHAASINPIDYKWLVGNYTLVSKLPWIPGFDVSGVVVGVGPSVKKFKAGDAVMGMANFRTCGTMAEYVCIDSRFLAAKPRSASFAHAASLPLAGLTSYQSLLAGGIQKGQKVLILGGSGGTGSLGVQIAKHGFGAAHVAVTCSAANAEWVKGLGADETVDYKTQNFWDVLKGQNYDIIYDCVGGFTSWEKSPLVLKPGGSYVTICGDRSGKLNVGRLAGIVAANANRKFWSLFGNPKYISLTTDNKRADQLEKLGAWVEEGKLRSVVDKSFALSEVAQLYKQSMSQRTRGKAVLAIVPDSQQDQQQQQQEQKQPELASQQ